MINLFLISIFTILPIYFICSYFYNKDTIKEPKSLLLNLFISGLFSGVIVAIISFIGIITFPKLTEMEAFNILERIIYCFIFVALTEELSKFFMIYKISYNNPEFDQNYDIILYSIYVALGFSLFENLIYINQSSSIITLAITRNLTAVPAHISFQAIMGYLLLKYKKSNNLSYLIGSITIPIILHGMYDYILFSINIYLLIIFIFILFVIYTIIIKIVNKTINDDKKM